MRWLVLPVLLSACLGDSAPDAPLLDPYTGEVHRFVVDGLTLPATYDEALALSEPISDDDLRNQVGWVIANVFGLGIGNRHATEQIAAGALQMSVEVQADSLSDDDAAAIWLHGSDDSSARPVWGQIETGVFISQRIRDQDLKRIGRDLLVLPVFDDADASPVQLAALQLSLTPDDAGGFSVRLQGIAEETQLEAAAWNGIVQMFNVRPDAHRGLWSALDRNRDGRLQPNEKDDSIVDIYVTPDVELGGTDYVTLGIGMHLSPCDDGRCAPVGTSYTDRVHNGDETDVDCGGGGGACGGGKRCSLPADCQSNRCESGVCTTPTCADGIVDGFESDVDCGGTCAGCELGQRCGYDFECAASNVCFEGTCQIDTSPTSR